MLPSLTVWVLFKTPLGLNFFGVMFMIRRRSRPFLYYHEWVWVQDDSTLEFAIPSFATMFRTWKRTFDAILRSGVAVPWSRCLFKVKSARTLGARFDCPGFNGRVHLRLEALQDLSAQFVFSPCLSSMRAPAFN